MPVEYCEIKRCFCTFGRSRNLTGFELGTAGTELFDRLPELLTEILHEFLAMQEKR